MSGALSLDRYQLMGRSGLRVSPLSLGTMTFGQNWGWGAEREEARRIFDMYVARGGNFVDTANQYTDGTAEQFIGAFVAGRRDRMVIATKYTLPARDGDPNSGGNHRKSMVTSVERSLRRLATDYIDLLYLHAWDGTTPPEEILRAMDDLVRAGKVLYLGISNTAAWRISQMQAIADLRGWSPLIVLQVEYNLVERTAERELIPMAHEMGLGITGWAPLKSGLLTGKYEVTDGRSVDEYLTPRSRREILRANGMFTQRSAAIVNVVRSIAEEIGKTPSQIALAWVLLNRTITPILGVRTAEQLDDNLGALEVTLTEGHRARLGEVSAIELGCPHDQVARLLNKGILHGGVTIALRTT
jgi:Predicted oxidoreductases (related to aryl-alcohol dehydrogenases)